VDCDTVSRGEGRPFIPPAELGGILAYFDKIILFLDIFGMG
jgi:hypothetical protein